MCIKQIQERKVGYTVTVCDFKKFESILAWQIHRVENKILNQIWSEVTNTSKNEVTYYEVTLSAVVTSDVCQNN
jgi:hypothetical protein